jgi:hypothetical protein
MYGSTHIMDVLHMKSLAFLLDQKQFNKLTYLLWVGIEWNLWDPWQQPVAKTSQPNSRKTWKFPPHLYSWTMDSHEHRQWLQVKPPKLEFVDYIWEASTDKLGPESGKKKIATSIRDPITSH